MTPYIISGLVVGSIYAISALGLVLTYTSSRVFNFAHGAIAYGIAVFYYYLTRQNGWSIATAAPIPYATARCAELPDRTQPAASTGTAPNRVITPTATAALVVAMECRLNGLLSR